MWIWCPWQWEVIWNLINAEHIVKVTKSLMHLFSSSYLKNMTVFETNISHCGHPCILFFIGSTFKSFSSFYRSWGASLVAPACQCSKHGFDPLVRKVHWRRKQQPTPVFLPGKSHGQKVPGGPQSKVVTKQLDTTWQLNNNNNNHHSWAYPIILYVVLGNYFFSPEMHQCVHWNNTLIPIQKLPFVF